MESLPLSLSSFQINYSFLKVQVVVLRHSQSILFIVNVLCFAEPPLHQHTHMAGNMWPTLVITLGLDSILSSDKMTNHLADIDF